MTQFSHDPLGDSMMSKRIWRLDMDSQLLTWGESIGRTCGLLFGGDPPHGHIGLVEPPSLAGLDR